MPNIAYLNGEFLPIEHAKVSIEDRGFQFGDGVYEVIRVYEGQPFRLQDHLTRLAFSAKGISLVLPLTEHEWGEIIREGLRRCGYTECKVYIQVTRGIAPRDHLFSHDLHPTIVVTFREMKGPSAELTLHGGAAITTPDLRWAKCSIKSLNLLPNILAKQAARDVGACEAIMIKDGYVTEGTSSNVALVKSGILITPSLTDQLLAGVTRKAVLELARQKGILVEERSVHHEELRQSDELFLIGTTIEVLPIIKVDHDIVGDGKPGKLTKRIQEAYKYLVQKSISEERA